MQETLHTISVLSISVVLRIYYIFSLFYFILFSNLQGRDDVVGLDPHLLADRLQDIAIRDHACQNNYCIKNFFT